MYDDVNVWDVTRKLVDIGKEKYICDIVIVSNEEALCCGENINTHEKTEWISIKDTLNPAFAFGEYLIKEYK
ncbi:hypothetical protein ACIQ4I_12250 [Rummeliibacillus sp. NPDC094406]|uniref:hypothetical protein n=1 Tax=Rummeliibacillus sp. NPDC094406 TaxID=3364511 RepID=UPI00382DB636